MLALSGLILLGIILLVGLTWMNLRYVSQDVGKNDFLPRWAGTRWFMVRGWSPYSVETTLDIQDMIYGRHARPSEDQGYYLYPFYSVLIYTPFSLAGNYTLARAIWMTVLQISLFGVMLASLSLSRWRPRVWIFMLLLGFVLFWFHSVIALLDSNLLILCTLFMVLSFLSIRSGNDVLGGFLIAIASVRPETMFLVIVFVLIWAISHERWQLFWSVLATIGFLVATGSLFIPDWTLQNIRQVYAYYSHAFVNNPRSLLTYWLPGVGNQLGWAFTLLMAGMLLWEWRAVLHQGFRWFLWTSYLTLAATFLIGMPTKVESYVVLMPALILILGTLDQRWGRMGRWLVVLSILALTLSGWAISIMGVRRGVPLTLDPLIFLFTPVIAIFGLYWVRWMAIYPPQLPLEVLGRQLSGGKR